MLSDDTGGVPEGIPCFPNCYQQNYNDEQVQTGWYGTDRSVMDGRFHLKPWCCKDADFFRIYHPDDVNEDPIKKILLNIKYL